MDGRKLKTDRIFDYSRSTLVQDNLIKNKYNIFFLHSDIEMKNTVGVGKKKLTEIWIKQVYFT